MPAKRALPFILTFALSWLLLVQGLPAPGGPSIAIAGTMAPDQSTDNSGSTPDQSGASNPASATATPAAAATPAASGTVLASDNFSNSSGGLFGTSSNAQWTWGYVGSDYQIASIGALVEQSHFQTSHGAFGDQTVAVDAHLGPNGDVGAAYGVGCRVTGGNNATGYILRINTQFSTWFLTRLQTGGAALLSNGGDNAIALSPPTSTHHLSLTCQGGTIAGSIDGTQVTSVQDGTYQQGSGALYAYSSGTAAGQSNSSVAAGTNIGGYPTKVDARFDNFVITQP
jgi:hypothetical protein